MSRNAASKQLKQAVTLHTLWHAVCTWQGGCNLELQGGCHGCKEVVGQLQLPVSRVWQYPEGGQPL